MPLRSTLVAALMIALSSVSAVAAPPPGEKVATRLPGHRNLFNGDCTFLFGDAFVADRKGRYDKRTLHHFIDMLADSGVDTYLQNLNAQVPWYPSKHLPGILNGYRRGDREFFRGHYGPDYPKDLLPKRIDEQVLFLNRYLDLAEDGVDWAAEIAKACRRRGVSPWVSVRMNDMHGGNSWEGSYMNCALQKAPKYRLSGREVNPRDGVNRKLQSLNYAHPEVRDYMFSMIREQVEDYDYEGLELDWLRCPFCCDAPASREAVDTMTKWTAKIRELTQKRARQRGKPYPLGLRLPVRFGLLRSVGLDVKAMVHAGLVDFVSFSNSWQTCWEEPLDELRRELGDKVAIYGTIQDAPNWLPACDADGKNTSYRLLTASPELLRGNAAGKLALGVDGIEQFNFFCTDEVWHNPAWKDRQARYGELRDLEKLDHLRGKPKHYALASLPGPYLFPLFEYAEQLPAVIEPDGKKAFRLPMCAEPAGGLELVVQLVFEKTEAAAGPGVSFNSSWPNFDKQETDRLVFPCGIRTHHVPENRAFNYHFPSSSIREGWNEVLVFNGSHKGASRRERAENAIRILSVELGVRRKKD